jgi:hypothetical protein
MVQPGMVQPGRLGHEKAPGAMGWRTGAFCGSGGLDFGEADFAAFATEEEDAPGVFSCGLGFGRVVFRP